MPQTAFLPFPLAPLSWVRRVGLLLLVGSGIGLPPLFAQTPTPVGLSVHSDTGPVDWRFTMENGYFHGCQNCSETGITLNDTAVCRVSAQRTGVLLAEQWLHLAPGHQHFVLTQEGDRFRLRFRGDEKPLDLRLAAPVPAGIASKMASVLPMSPASTEPPTTPPTTLPSSSAIAGEPQSTPALSLASVSIPAVGMGIPSTDPIEQTVPNTGTPIASSFGVDSTRSLSNGQPEGSGADLLQQVCALEHQYDRLKAAEEYARSKSCSPDELQTLLGCLNHDFSKLELLRAWMPAYAQTPGFEELGELLEYPWTRAAFQESFAAYVPSAGIQLVKP